MVTLVFGYGISRMIADMEFMLGGAPGIFMYITWKYCLPSGSGGECVLAVTSLTNFEPVTLKRHGHPYEFPLWSQIAGFVVAAIGLSIIPIVAIKELWVAKWDFRKAIAPRDSWGPKSYEDRRRYRLFMVDKGFMKADEAERLNESEKELRELEIKEKALEEAKEAAEAMKPAEKPEPGAAGEAVKPELKEPPKSEPPKAAPKADAKGEAKADAKGPVKADAKGEARAGAKEVAKK
ncbi:hypothetical protein MTO96_004408 [Rhipicephalus appendiculatus]